MSNIFWGSENDKPKDRIDIIGQYVLGGLVLFALLSVMAIVAVTGSSTGTSGSDELDRLQQDRFKYERQVQDTKDQMELRETINKIKSGYYQ